MTQRHNASPLVAVPDFLVRPVDPADADRLRAFYAELSPQSRRLRFLGTGPGIGSASSRAFCAPDHVHAEGFVAEPLTPAEGGRTVAASGPDSGPILAHLCLEPDGSGGTEFAIAVADAWQRGGIGRRLMEHALAWATDRGIETLSATALATNIGLQRLVRAVAPDATILGRAGGLIDVIIRVGRDVPSGPHKGAVGPITGRRWRAILRA